MQHFPITHSMPISKGNQYIFPTRIAKSTPANSQPHWEHIDTLVHLQLCVLTGVHGHAQARPGLISSSLKAEQLELILQ